MTMEFDIDKGGHQFMTTPSRHLQRKLFAVFSAYLIFTTNFVGVLSSSSPREGPSWARDPWQEELYRNPANGLLRRSVFRPSRPCCRGEGLHAVPLEVLRADQEIFFPRPRPQRPFLSQSLSFRRPSLLTRVSESLSSFNPFRNERPFPPEDKIKGPQRPSVPLLVQTSEVRPPNSGPGDSRPSTYARFLAWLSKFRPSKGPDPHHIANKDSPEESVSSSNSTNEHRPHTTLIPSTLGGGAYSFQDVLSGIRRNESNGLLLKKFLSAASALSERSGSDPAFMLWTIPTTLFAFLGVFYFIGAVLILGYKYILFANDSTNGQAVSLLPVFVSFLIPIGLATLFVTSRGILSGQISPSRVVRGDGGPLRHDFDPLHFGLDATFGTFTLLGIGWLVSIAV